MILYVGTFTGGFMGGAPSEGLYVWHFDAAAGVVEHMQTVGGLFSPSFLCRHPTLPLLYAVERKWSEDDATTGALTTLAIDDRGHIAQIDRRRAGGAFSAHVNVSPDGCILTTANPLGPTVASFPLKRNGIPNEPVSLIRYEGTGARPRQSAPWPHSTFADTSSSRVFVCDLGLDRIAIYDIERASGALSPAPQQFAQVSSGAGARHLAVHPNGRFLYVVNELDSTLSIFAYDGGPGSVVIVQTTSTVPDGYTDENHPAEVACTGDGRFLFVTNRGHDSIAVFRIDEHTGRAKLLGWTSTFGRTPRHVAVSPDGAYVFVSNQMSGEIVVFHIDAATGILSPTGQHIPVPSASCVVFG